MVKRILEYFPEHTGYLEPYGGAGTILLNKPVSPIEVFNDLDDNIAAFYTVLQSDRFTDLIDLCQQSIYHESLAREYRDSLRGSLTPLQRAYRFWYVNRTFRGGGLGGFSINTAIRRGMSKSVSDFLSSIDRLPDIHIRLSHVVILNQNALELITRYDRPGWFFYLDPPYMHETRTSARYRVDADDEHHARLLDLLTGLRHAKVLLSGYDNPLYQNTLSNWRHITFSVKTVSGTNNPKTKMECLWKNYD